MKFFFIGFVLSSFMFLSPASHAGILVTGGFEGRFEQGMDQNTDFLPNLDFAAEYHWENYFLGAEYFRGFTQSTGNASLSLNSLSQGAWFTGAYEAGSWRLGKPYLRAGFGAYQDSVVTTLLGNSTTNVSRLYLTGFAGVGLQFDLPKSMFASLESHLVFGENQVPQPAFAVMARIGWEFGKIPNSKSSPNVDLN